jgi:hypothetical protein
VELAVKVFSATPFESVVLVVVPSVPPPVDDQITTRPASSTGAPFESTSWAVTWMVLPACGVRLLGVTA